MSEQNNSILQDELNSNNDTDYIKSSNAVKLLPIITNNQGKIKLYTETNSNIKIGDKVFIMYDDTHIFFSEIILDNYLEFSDCDNWIFLKQFQGYEVIDVNENNNEITINRYYDSKFIGKSFFDHYISKIYIRNLKSTGGVIDGATIRNCDLNMSNENLTQAIILEGVSNNICSKNKYDDDYISINSFVSTATTISTYKPYLYNNKNTPTIYENLISSYYSKNNNNYGYTIMNNVSIQNSKIDNGYYYNCEFNNCELNGGHYSICDLKSCTVNNGNFEECDIDNNSIWFYGQWSGSTDFLPNVWYDGIWNYGNFLGREWKNGIFNDGNFSGSTWKDGVFNGGSMYYSTWSNGSFNNGLINWTYWENGIFNDGEMINCTWIDGVCNGGDLLNTSWTGGIFNDGVFQRGIWYNGTFNNGLMYKTHWYNGTFNNGIFNSENSVTDLDDGYIKLNNFTSTDSYWEYGYFMNGNFKNSIWQDGIFYNGFFEENSFWFDGTFKYGEFKNSFWAGGTNLNTSVFENGNVTSSYFHNVNWISGNWNSGQLGMPLATIPCIVYWSGGTFNNGIFGSGNQNMSSDTDVRWYNGNFYNGTFYSYYINEESDSPNSSCIEYTGECGFHDGIFYNGNFYGTFWGGVWMTGNFDGCNKSGKLISNYYLQNNLQYGVIIKRYGDGKIND